MLYSFDLGILEEDLDLTSCEMATHPLKHLVRVSSNVCKNLIITELQLARITILYNVLAEFT